MMRRAFLFAALMLAAAPASRAQERLAPFIPAVSTTVSPDFPQVTCTSANAIACNDTLELASTTRDQLASVLKLDRTWRFPVHVHILTPDDPLTAKINREASAAFAQGATMKLEVVVPIGDPNAREYIQRQYVIAMLWEKFFANTKTFDKHTQLDLVPFWLIEGLREMASDDPEHIRENIVRRATQNETAPTLEQVTRWRELSNDRLLGLWQRAFSFYLVDSMTEQGTRRADFQKWLDSFSNPDAAQAQLHFPIEEAWQRELVEAPARSRNIVYTWAETASEVAHKEVITYAESKNAKVQTCTIDSVSTQPRTPALIQAVQERIRVLTELELRAHPGWHPVLDMYRSALTAFASDRDAPQAQKFFDEAKRMREKETAHHQGLVDYINWFEVTRNYDDESTHFQSYFTTAKEMERIQADPKHPNPIRANLLLIESEL